jgi:phosphoglycolate phosphatase
MNGTAPKDSFFDSLKVIAFDCDGVLFDSREANTRFYSHILELQGFPPVRPDQQQYVHMHPVRESLRFLLGEGSAFEEALAYAQTMDFRLFNACLHPEPGLMEFLPLVHSRFFTALATNRTVSTHQVLAHFHIDSYFDLVVSASDVAFPKPHPETMERIMSTFGVRPREILFIGDSPVDEALAQATGVHFTAYKNTSLTADLHISHFQALQPLLFGGSVHPPK